MKDLVREDPKIAASAEHQMQMWAMAEEIGNRTAREHCQARLASQKGLYLAISRESGAGGSEIAQLVGERLGWEVLDRELLDRVAQRYHEAKTSLEPVDETTGSWVTDIVGGFLDPATIPRERYVAQLTRVVLSAWRRGSVVIVGRGAQFILPREQGLAVRLIAPRKWRIERIRTLLGLAPSAAAKFIDAADRGRRDFVQRCFHHDIEDPHLYDMVLNIEQYRLEDAVELILMGLCRLAPVSVGAPR